jgi:dTDP-4-amino-4,6-dideoxygalactose transaminase
MTQIQMQGLEHYYRQAHVRPPHPDSPHPHQPSPSSIGHHTQAHSYSQELHHQQQEQMRQQQQERQEAARRHSEEAEYLQSLFHPQQPQQQQQQQHQYFTISEDHSHRHPYQMHHPVHDQPPLLSPPAIDQGYAQAHHPQIQQEQRYLAEEQEPSPTMTKYGSPSLLHTPPLLLE